MSGPILKSKCSQFVVVNQKATAHLVVRPSRHKVRIHQRCRAMKSVTLRRRCSRNRWNRSVEESQAITYLARHPDSPFRRSRRARVGIAILAIDVLKWNRSLQSLIAIFRTLRATKSCSGNDQRLCRTVREATKPSVPSSEIVAPYEARGFRKPEDVLAADRWSMERRVHDIRGLRFETLSATQDLNRTTPTIGDVRGGQRSL